MDINMGGATNEYKHKMIDIFIFISDIWSKIIDGSVIWYVKTAKIEKPNPVDIKSFLSTDVTST